MHKNPKSYLFVFFLPFFCFADGSFASAQEEQSISFDRDIRPLLSDRCYACHGPDPNSRAADLRLDLEEESHGFAIEPGSLDDSELWNRITSDDPDEVMPPPDSHKKPFTKDEQKLIGRWIKQGAKYEKFWAFVPPAKPTVPKTNDKKWSKSTIDQLVYQTLEQKQLRPSAEADSRKLVRRVALDLTGLPPTLDQLNRFIATESEKGRDAAWNQWTDELLASPRFGEHMARYWLDLVRFADTNGMHKDFYRNHFAYRDWVIRAYNQNLPYDKFLSYQLAGDLYPSPTKDQLTATAFNRLHLIIDRGTALPEESFHKNVIDRVTAVSTAFLGLTMQCAQCHDHKYDPISQKEYYAFYGFFNNLDAQPETNYSPPNGLQPPFISLADAAQEVQLQQLDTRLKQLDKQIQQKQSQLKAIDTKIAKKTTPTVKKPATKDDTAKQKSKLQTQLKELQATRKKAAAERKAFDRHVPYAMVMKERKDVRPTYLLEGGQYDAPREQIERATPAFLPDLKPQGSTPTRLDLARWFTNPEHPLTARVAVNRLWQNLLGRGLVKTSEDLGAQGDVPSHPELLDYLAVRFVETGWDTKKLVKEIVMSQTYRQSSIASPQQFQSDPDNQWLARGARFRLDAEVIRDQLLFTSGTLVERMYGPSVKPPQPNGLWKSVTMTGQRYVADTDDNASRRSLYTFWKRAMPPPQMTIMNAPMRDACIARRERTNTPTQALLLLNEPAYLKAARSFAIRMLKIPPQGRISHAWETITARQIQPNEQKTVGSLLDELKTYYQAHPELTDKACQGLASKWTVDQKVEIAAMTAVLNSIYNLDITRNRD